MQDETASKLTDSERHELNALQTRLTDVRDLVRDAVRQRDFAAMECGFDVYRELLDEQKALLTGEPIPEPRNAVQPRVPALLGPWAYFSLCPICRRTGTPQSWSKTGPQMRIEYSCERCEQSWGVTGTEAATPPLRRPAHIPVPRPEVAARPSFAKEPPDWFAVGGAIVAGIVLGGGVLLRLLPMAMNLMR